jgi:hypothetical protein
MRVRQKEHEKMTFSIKLDFSDFERRANELSAAADQVPFALARSLNQAVEDAQTVLIVSTWPKSVTVRNTSFMRAALRRRFASKHNLTAEIYDTLHRGHLKEHAIGGTKTARGANIAIPSRDIPLGSSGVSKSNRPAALIARTAKRALRITPRGIYVGKGGRLTLKYALRRSVPIPADVPFESDFAAAVRSGVRTSFPYFIKKAMATRRR